MTVDDRRHKIPVWRYLAFLTQLGLSVACPVVLGAWLGSFLQRRFGLGSWITLVLLLLGILSAGCGLIRFMRYVLRESKKSEEKKKDDASA